MEVINDQAITTAKNVGAEFLLLVVGGWCLKPLFDAVQYAPCASMELHNARHPDHGLAMALSLTYASDLGALTTVFFSTSNTEAVSWSPSPIAIASA